VTRDLYGQSFAIASPTYVPSTLAVCRVNPRYAIDDQQRPDIIAHGVPALDDSPLVAHPSLLSVPRHQFFFDRAPLLTPLLTAAIVTIAAGFDGVIRSMCK
jgi:hypothetical protein